MFINIHVKDSNLFPPLQSPFLIPRHHHILSGRYYTPFLGLLSCRLSPHQSSLCTAGLQNDISLTLQDIAMTLYYTLNRIQTSCLGPPGTNILKSGNFSSLITLPTTTHFLFLSLTSFSFLKYN